MHDETFDYDTSRRAAAVLKVAQTADFSSDMSTWPDEMIHAYLEGDGNESQARAALLRLLGGHNV